jgi:hypothetical protein
MLSAWPSMVRHTRPPVLLWQETGFITNIANGPLLYAGVRAGPGHTAPRRHRPSTACATVVLDT